MSGQPTTPMPVNSAVNDAIGESFENAIAKISAATGTDMREKIIMMVADEKHGGILFKMDPVTASMTLLIASKAISDKLEAGVADLEAHKQDLQADPEKPN